MANTWTVGALALNFSVNTAALATGLGKANSLIGGFTARLGKITSVAGGLTGAIAGIGAAIGAVKFGNFLVDSAREVDNILSVAKALNATTQEVIAFGHFAEVAGSDTNTMHTALKKLQLTIGQTATGSGKAGKAFQQLGIDAKSLQGATLTQQYNAVADAIASIEDNSIASAAAVSIFGRSAQQLLPVLREGSAGLRAATTDAEMLGLMFSNASGEKINAAIDNWWRAGLVFKAIGKVIAVELAPYVVALTDEFIAAANAGDGFASRLRSTAETVDSIIKGFAVVGKTLDVVWSGITLAYKSIFEVALHYTALVAQTLQGLVNLLPGVSAEFGDFAANTAELYSLDTKQQFKDLKQDLKDLSEGNFGNSVTEWLDGIQAAADKNAQAMDRMRRGVGGVTDDMEEGADAAQELLASLQEQITYFGKSPRFASIDKLALEGFDQTVIDQLANLDQQLTQLEQTKSIEASFTDRIKSIVEATESPLEAFQEQMEELNRFLQSGAISDVTFERAAKLAEKTLLDSRPQQQRIQFADANVFGSAAARSTIIRSQADTAMASMQDHTAELVQLGRQQVRVLTELERKAVQPAVEEVFVF